MRPVSRSPWRSRTGCRRATPTTAPASALGFVARVNSFRADEWALVREAALLLETCGRPGRALEIWKILFSATELPRELRVAWLSDARATALAAKDAAQAGAWERDLASLMPPPAAVVEKK